jgi:hypothetical protein
MRRNTTLSAVIVLAITVLMLTLPFRRWVCFGNDEEGWIVRDAIEPSLDSVRWFEEGGIRTPPSWISDGSWYGASMRQSLVAPSDIFVETYEYFNWTRVKSMAEYYFGLTFDSFDDFADFADAQPGQWLDLSWQMDTEWYGVPSNSTKIKCSYNETSAEAEMWIWFHITRIPEYFAGEGKLESWLTGFDLTSVSTGNLELWELRKDWGGAGIYYSLQFKAPANLLFQHNENYTLSLGVLSSYQGRNFGIEQTIDIEMPADTEIKEASPSSLSVSSGNTANFLITKDDTYPAAFTVVSGSPSKPFSQQVWEGVTLWFTTPGGWAAIGSLSLLSFTGLRGRRIWNRNRMYHRVYKSMVTIYDLYSRDLLKFNQEMDNMSRSIIKMLIEDKITDEQFEKLLRRRDDLLLRSTNTFKSESG